MLAALQSAKPNQENADVNRPHRRRNKGAKRKRDRCDLGDCCSVGDLGGSCMIGLFSVAFMMLRPMPAVAGGPQGWFASLLWRRVRAYQLYVSASRPPCCPMTPTCSRYSLDALQAHGALRGAILTVQRLRRCRPGAATMDPVPAVR